MEKPKRRLEDAAWLARKLLELTHVERCRLIDVVEDIGIKEVRRKVLPILNSVDPEKSSGKSSKKIYKKKPKK